MTKPIARVTAVGLATVQDGGRSGHTHVGVPVSGALHRLRYAVAGALVAGAPDPRLPAIEVLAGTLGLRVEQDTTLAAVGPARLEVDGRRAAVGSVLLVPAGAHVVVEPDGPGPAYLAIDGWTPARVLGSAATDTFSRLGPAPLRAGDELPGTPTAAGRDRVGAFHRALPAESGPLRVVGGSHAAARALASATWQVTSTARSGVRLAGGPMPPVDAIASIPVLPGAVQVTPSGEAIVLGPDGGLTGGYPVLGVVATADLDRVSTFAAGSAVAFRLVTPQEAVEAHHVRAALVRGCIAHPGHLP